MQTSEQQLDAGSFDEAIAPGGVPGFTTPICCASSPGSTCDHYVEDMVRFYLSEEPLLGSVRTCDPGIREHRDVILDRIEDLVVKPPNGFGGPRRG